MVVAFIPVRCGSKSIPFKNIKSFCGKPLIYWTANAASGSLRIDEIFISTDCEQIKEEVEKLNLPKVKIYKRSKENAQDHSSTESAMLEFISDFNFNKDDTFILIQATTPFLEGKHLDGGIEKYFSGEDDSILSCVRYKRFFWNKDGTPVNYDFRKRPRRQDFDGIFLENGAFYVNKIGNIISHSNRLSGRVGIYEMPEYSSIELDEEDDWLLAEQLMHKHVIKNESGNIKLFAMDIDGVLTDAGVFYGKDGEIMKKFNVRDGMGISLIKKSGIKTAFITSEDSEFVTRRAEKLKIDHVYMNKFGEGKLNALKEICAAENIQLSEVAYIGDDINCIDALKNVGISACPVDAHDDVIALRNIKILTKKGGDGAVREFADFIIKNKNSYKS